MESVGFREMIAALRAVQPEYLPPSININKQNVRTLDAGTPPAPQKPRDARFDVAVKAAFAAFRDAKRDYLLNLEPKVIKALARRDDVFLTLRAIKPCTLFTFAGPPTGDGVLAMNGLVLECLAPVLAKSDLEAYGFRLQYLATDVLIKHKGFKGGWVLADTKAAQWPLVKDLFFEAPAHPQRENMQETIGRALGYPARMGYNTVTFKDVNEEQALDAQLGTKVDGVSGVHFWCIDGTAQDMTNILYFFKACNEAAQSAGIALRMDLNEYPAMKARFEQWKGAHG
ncbi:Uu.00g065390.m01.CDS01 [Anthostomella pinea]|uniref:Uu.00g065390.m01.CDS01 n=1 Tax=Anthostomella pinea TaxID=933095 RepID=A0AAI8VTT1_9PEZI|nr:Uu.00g065390.m01.CDS01 [Anthostomella pinea]